MRDFLLQHADLDPISFHMPGHKGSAIFRRYGFGEFLDRFVDCDVTEIPGADNLFQAEGIIMDVQKKYASLYDVDHSYLMINGTSGGLIASILASVCPGGKLIMARNCHKSVFNALTLGSIRPVYAQPRLLREHGIMGEVTAEEIARCIEEHPDAEAVILPSPNYYGICSAISSIAKVCHEAGKILIVDQAHGAHLKFFHRFGYGEDLPPAAETCGADLVVNSIHKTLASLTQSAVLNLQGNLVDRYVLEDKIQAIESTSPSYILMSFLDINADLLLEHGAEAMGEWREAVDWFYAHAKAVPGLHLMDAGYMDHTKINLDMSVLGIDGARLEKLLMDRGIFSELHTGNILMLMTGIGNTREHMEKTVAALQDIAESALSSAPAPVIHTPDFGIHVPDSSELNVSDSNAPRVADSGKLYASGSGAAHVPEPGPLHDIPRDKEFVPLADAAGRISAGSIIPYPPGIPLVCPGEEITEDIITYLHALRAAGEKVIGINDRQQVLVSPR